MNRYDPVITIQRVKSETKSKNTIFRCNMCSRNILFKSKRQLLHHFSRNHKDEVSKEEYLRIRKIVKTVEQAYLEGVLVL